MRKHIFNAGPCVLSEPARVNTSKACIDLDGIGQSLLEISHRGKEFQAIFDETVALFKEIMSIPEGYSVLFLGGGASLQFAMIPFNYLKTKAAYLNTGVWAKKAIKEAQLFGQVEVVGTSEDKNFTYIPKNFTVPADADYFHITTNNTIKGTEIHVDFDCKVPLIADMSSDIMSRPVDVSKYAIIYGGAQKNLGPAGVTFVIIKDSFMEEVANRPIPTMLKYTTHQAEGSMFNTPPVLPIYVIRETLKWTKSIGGIEKMYEMNKAKAQLLYDAMDSSKMFVGTVAKEDRSLMNICFVMQEPYKELEADFIKYAQEKGCVGIKGHRSVGGFRASCYNALPIESVQVLVDAMNEFEKKHI